MRSGSIRQNAVAIWPRSSASLLPYDVMDAYRASFCRFSSRNPVEVPAPARDQQLTRGSRPKNREGFFRDGQNAVTKQHKDIGWSRAKTIF